MHQFNKHQIVSVRGTIVHVYSKGHAYEVELVDAMGNSTVLTLDNYQVSQSSFTCPDCGWISHNLNDVQNNYCGHCHKFWGDTKTKTSKPKGQ